MGFGIEIVGNDGAGDFLVTDTDQNLINYQISAQGQASQIATSAVSGAELFINGNVSGSQGHYIASELVSGYYNFKKVSYTQSGGVGQHITNVSTSAATCNYIILKKMGDNANGTNNIPYTGANYGIQLFTSTGILAFDSRSCNIANSFKFQDAKAPRTVSGNEGQISTNGDNYLNIDALFSLIPPNSTEADVSACKWAGTGTAAGRMKFLHFFSSGELQSTTYRSNHGTMILGEPRA